MKPLLAFFLLTLSIALSAQDPTFRTTNFSRWAASVSITCMTMQGKGTLVCDRYEMVYAPYFALRKDSSGRESSFNPHFHWVLSKYESTFPNSISVT